MLDGLAHPGSRSIAVLQVSIEEVKRLRSPHSNNQHKCRYCKRLAVIVTRISDVAELATSCRIPQLQTDSVQKIATTPITHNFKVTIIQRQITRKWYNIELYLQWPTNRKSYMGRTAQFSMTLKNPSPV